MKALTICQPYAALIISGEKRVEDGRSLTAKQLDTLNAIWDRIT